MKPVDIKQDLAGNSYPGTDAGTSLVLDDQPAGNGGKSGKAALEKQAGNGSVDH